MPVLGGSQVNSTGPFGSRDIAIFFQDGSLVTRQPGGASFMAHFDYPDMIENFSQIGGQQLGQVEGHPALRFATIAALDLQRGNLVTIGGVQYRVRSVDKEGDGQVSVARLATA